MYIVRVFCEQEVVINCRNDDLMMMTLKMMMTTQKQTLRRKLMHLEHIGAKDISKSQLLFSKKITKNYDDVEDEDDYSKTNVEKKADAP